MNKISAIMITKNEEVNLPEALESIKWADEIIVVDAESKDSTKDVALMYTDKVYTRKWEGFADQKSYALSLANNEWILSLDADERVSPKLYRELQELDFKKDGYYIPRENYFLNKQVNSCGWNNDYQLRLFRKCKTQMNKRLVHEGFIVDGETGRLENPIVHLTFVSIEKAIEKINVYSSLEAKEKWQSKKKIKAHDIFLHGLASFLRDFISLKGYKDGVYGLILSFLSGLTTLLVYSKIWEFQNSGSKK